MSWRERVGANINKGSALVPSTSRQDNIDAEASAIFGLGEGALHPCWQPVTLPSGLCVFENRYTGTPHHG